MARPVWSGSVSFGLVNIGVGLYSATENRDVSFHQFEKGTDKRVRNKRVAEGTDREVAYEDITKGYETDSGEHVIITQEELESVQPETSRAITIDDFVELADIDPIYYQRSYYLAPRGEEHQHAYALLRDAMKDAGLAGIATLVMRNKQYLAAIRAQDDVLVLTTMHFADEIRRPRDVADDIPGRRKLPKKEFDTAVALIKQLSTEWKPETYHDTYREQVLRVVEQKAKGQEVDVEEPPEPQGDVIDLVAALEQSIQKARDRNSSSGGRGKSSKSGSSKSASSKSSGSKRRSATGGATSRSSKNSSGKGRKKAS